MKRIGYCLLISLSLLLSGSEKVELKKWGAVVVVGRIMSGKSTLLKCIKREMSQKLPLPYVISTDQYLKDFAQIKRADYLKGLIRNMKSNSNEIMSIAERERHNRTLNGLEKELERIKDNKSLEKSLRDSQKITDVQQWIDEDRAESFWLPYNMQIEDALVQKAKWIVCDVCSNAEPVRNDLMKRLLPYRDHIVLVKLDAKKKIAKHRLTEKSMSLFAEIHKIYLKEQSQECIRTLEETLARRVSGQKHDLEQHYENRNFYSLAAWDNQKNCSVTHDYDLSFDSSSYAIATDDDNDTKTGYEDAAFHIVAFLRKKTGHL